MDDPIDEMVWISDEKFGVKLGQDAHKQYKELDAVPTESRDILAQTAVQQKLIPIYLRLLLSTSSHFRYPHQFWYFELLEEHVDKIDKHQTFSFPFYKTYNFKSFYDLWLM